MWLIGAGIVMRLAPTIIATYRNSQSRLFAPQGVEQMRVAAFSTTLLVSGLFAAPAALAGGVGINLIGGTHMESVYQFDAQGTKFESTQHRPSYGVGLQVLLGDRDDDLQGVMKFSWGADSPAVSANVSTPDGFDAPTDGSSTIINGRLACDDPAYLEHLDGQACGTTNLGIASAGLQFRVWGEADELMVTVTPSVGASVMTNDSTETLQVEVAPGFSYSLSDELVLNGEMAFQTRYRKGASFGVMSYVGMRYMFD